MNPQLTAAKEAVAFIRAQKLEGQAGWKRTDEAKSGADRSLYRGSSGVILALLELHAAGLDDQALQEAVAAGEDVMTYVLGKDWLSVSPSTGWPGYAFILNELALATGRDDFKAAAATCLERLMAQAHPLASAGSSPCLFPRLPA